MKMNIDTFTDEQLLNLVNNSILEKTVFSITDFTGGYVSITLNTNKKQDTCKVALLFGYKNRNSQSVIFEVDANLIYIWIKAIRLKIESLKIDNTGMDYNQLNGLMNTSYELRTKAHCTLPLTSTNLPITFSKQEIENLKNFIQLKYILTEKNKDENGNQLVFNFDKREVSISDEGIAYFRDSVENLSPAQSDKFFKELFSIIKA